MSRNKDSIKSDRLRFQEALDTRLLGRESRWLGSISSTNGAAKNWADSGAKHGSMVFADFQTRGRGRHGRNWDAVQGLNLTVSLVLRPNLPVSQLGLITLGASLAVRESIDACCSGVRSTIKWPNDILIENKKCCGMLLESAIGKGPSDSFVILGIGLNVNQASFPDTFSESATSIMLGYGRPVDRILLLADLLRRLEDELTRLNKDPEIVVSDYESKLDGIGCMFGLTDVHSGATFSGLMTGVDRTGALLLEIDSQIHTFHAGDVQRVVNTT